MTTLHRLIIGALAATTMASAAAAQTLEQVAGYTGLLATPAGALPPNITRTIVGGMHNGAALALRYGYADGGALNSVSNAAALTAILPAGLGSTVSLTAGVNSNDCNGCDPQLMVGVGGDVRIGSTAFGATADASRISFTVDGELGYAKLDGDGSAFSGHVSVPVALVPGSRGTGMRFVPFVAPGFGFARVSSSSIDDNGSRITIGGGVAIYNPTSTVMFNLGVRHIAIEDGETRIGLGLALNW